MYIIVVGGGKVGYYLTKTLLQDGHEVLVIEKQAAKCEAINEEMGSICMRGDGCEAAILEDSGTGRADLLIAVTGDDEDNLVACQVAKEKFHVPRTIARVNNPKNAAIFRKLALGVAVSSTELILEHIEQALPAHPLVHLSDLKDWGLELVEVRIPPNSPMIGQRLRDLPLPPGSLLPLIINKGKGPLIPTWETTLEAEDLVLALTKPEWEADLRAALTGA
ncbi:MAG: NAD-binding protein [Chloroflexota bacterium]|nr:NAD-binding protein [Chloroflexota bacterium]